MRAKAVPFFGEYSYLPSASDLRRDSATGPRAPCGSSLQHGHACICSSNLFPETELATRSNTASARPFFGAPALGATEPRPAGISREFLLQLIDDHAESSMHFSPAEYARSSRKRLVDDLRPLVARSWDPPVPA